MDLQELLAMPLLSTNSIDTGSYRQTLFNGTIPITAFTIIRVPGGWLFDLVFVPEPASVNHQQKDDWISVKETLPEHGRRVFLWDGGWMLGIFKFHAKGEFADVAVFTDLNDRGPYGLNEVEYWKYAVMNSPK